MWLYVPICISQSLYEKYKDEGFVVLGVPREISFKNTPVKKMLLSFVQQSMELTFQCLLLLKFAVAKPVLCTKNLLLSGEEPSWNFNKYLISRDGQQIYKYGSKIKPDSPELTKQIEELL